MACLCQTRVLVALTCKVASKQGPKHNSSSEILEAFWCRRNLACWILRPTQTTYVAIAMLGACLSSKTSSQMILCRANIWLNFPQRADAVSQSRNTKKWREMTYINYRDPPSAKKQLHYCDTASCVKVDSFNPKCNQQGCKKTDALNFQMKPVVSKLTPSILNATSLVAWNHSDRNRLLQCWLHLWLKESILKPLVSK